MIMHEPKLPLPYGRWGLVIAVLFIVLPLAGCAQRLASYSSPVEEPAIIVTASEPSVVIEKRVEYPMYAGNPAASIEEAKSRVSFSVAVPKVLPAGYRLEAIRTSYP